jgi:hypothetical protein
MKASEILSSARSLIIDGWCQRADARDARGREVTPWSPEARAWSVLGALVGADGVGRPPPGVMPIVELGEAIVALGDAGATHSLESWNDAEHRTRAEVIALFDRALALVATEAPVAHLRSVS